MQESNPIGGAATPGQRIVYRPPRASRWGATLLEGIMGAFDLIMSPLQRLIGSKNMPYVFVLPNLIIFGIFVFYPVLMNFYYSMTGGSALFASDRPYIGFENYRQLFDCANILTPATCREDRFWRGVFNTSFFVVVQVSVMVGFALVTALVLNRSIRGRGVFRSVFFYPVLLSPVVVALIWKWIIAREGILNGLLNIMSQESIIFLLDGRWAMFWVIFVSVWAHMGFYTLILLAGLQAIPADVYEAGSIDGADSARSFRYLTLPLLMPTLFVVTVLSMIRSVQVFDEVYALTGGGPGSATYFMVQYIYDTGFASQIQRFGLAAAASVLLGFALLVLTLIQLRVSRATDQT